MLLQHYFSLAPKQADTAGTARRLTVQAASQRLMSVAIRPIAEELTLAPLADPATPERAGPPFELYSDISLSPYPSARWIILLERFDALVDECRSLGKEFKRIEEIGESLSIMRRDLAAAAQGVA